VVEGGQHGDVRQFGVRLGGDGSQRGRRGVHREQVVHARTGDQLTVAAQVGGRFDGVRHQVPAGDLRGIDARRLGDEADEVALLDVTEPPDRLHVLLAVELEALRVGGPVQVHGQLRDAQQRAVDVDQPVRAVAQGEAAGETEVPVEPGVQERPAVDLDGDLAPAVRTGVGQRLDAEVGGVGVGPHDPERGVGAGALRHVPGHDGAAPQDVLPAQRAVPGIRLLDLPEPGLLQPCGGRGHSVVRGGCGHQEGHQIVGVPAVEAEGRAHVPHCNDGGPGRLTVYDGGRGPVSGKLPGTPTAPTPGRIRTAAPVTAGRGED
jgi:hypothetical protein